MPFLLIISSQLIHHLSLGGALMHYSSRIESNSTMSPCWPVFSAKYTGIHELSCTYFEITGLWPHAGILFFLCIPHAVWPGMWVLQRRKGELRMLVSLEGCERIPHNSTQPWCGWPSASCHGRQLRNVCYCSGWPGLLSNQLQCCEPFWTCSPSPSVQSLPSQILFQNSWWAKF